MELQCLKQGFSNFICWRPPYSFLEILQPLKVSCDPLGIKISHKSASTLEFIGQIDLKILITNGDHFLETGDPQKGRDP